MRSPRAALALCALAGCFSDGGPKTTGASSDTSSTSTSAATSGSTSEESPSSTSSGHISCPLEQMHPYYVDGDGDGYGAGPLVLGCEVPAGAAAIAGDCDDAALAVHPGAIELCNEMDDDCDGLRDEFSIMNTVCGPCSLAEYGGWTYWVCKQSGIYDAAEAWCQTRGAHLAYPGDPDELSFILGVITTLLGGEMPPELRFWIGVRRKGELWNSCDMNPEPGNWLTVLGAVAEHLPWRDGEPATLDCNPDCTAIEYADPMCIRENCVDITEVATGRWDSRFCNSDGLGLVCEAPLPSP